MKVSIALILLAAAIAAPTTGRITAQTCKVNVGKCTGGAMIFKEVFEYDYVDTKPEFPGGGNCLVNYINEHREYPEEAYSKGVQGRVICSFIVNPDGSLSNVSVIKGVEESLNREAVRIISGMPCWSPGKIEGQKVPVRVVCTVPFRK